ncbi:MAG: hypothetical protein K2I90_11235, partial [Odoribacter sp.]|nr:hypothetical protein [Odoribacter sp.]
IYMNKLAYIVSLIEQIKRYPIDDLYDSLEIAHIEEVLNMPEIADRNWENDTPLNQKAFLRFLETCISIFEETLNRLERKNT